MTQPTPADSPAVNCAFGGCNDFAPCRNHLAYRELPDSVKADIQAWKQRAVVAARIQGARTTSTVLQYVIEAHSGFMGDSKAAAKHWKKQTDKLIQQLTAQPGTEGDNNE